MKTSNWFFLVLLFYFPLIGHCLSSQPGKKALFQIEDAKTKTNQKLQWLDKRIQDQLNKSNFEDNLNEFATFKKLRREYLLRLEFYNRLQLGIESHFTSGDLQPFLIGYLLKFSEIELKNQESHSQLWKASLFMSQALDKTHERFEDPIEFLISYIEFSTLSNPKSPQNFIQNRNYTNGREFVKGNPVEVTKLQKAITELPAPVKIKITLKKDSHVDSNMEAE
jgi:hypothetical protein